MQLVGIGSDETWPGKHPIQWFGVVSINHYHPDTGRPTTRSEDVAGARSNGSNSPPPRPTDRCCIKTGQHQSTRRSRSPSQTQVPPPGFSSCGGGAPRSQCYALWFPRLCSFGSAANRSARSRLPSSASSPHPKHPNGRTRGDNSCLWIVTYCRRGRSRRKHRGRTLDPAGKRSAARWSWPTSRASRLSCRSINLPLKCASVHVGGHESGSARARLLRAY